MSIFGDGGASDTIDDALKSLKSTPVPTAQSMQVQLQKLVQMGILTPEQVSAYTAGPNGFDSITTSPIGTQAQIEAINKLRDIASSGGMDAEEAAALQDVVQNLNTQERGQRGSVLQSAAERGTLTGGLTTAAQLQAIQGDADTAYKSALDTNAAAEQRALQALTTSGSMGSALEGQQFGEQAQKATAANAIEAFNAQQKSQAAQFNANTKNAAQAQNLSETQRVADTNTSEENTNRIRNADLIQRQFEDTLAKEKAAAGEAGDLAKVEQQGATNDAGFAGNLIGAAGGAGGTALATYLKSQGPTPPATGSHGGVVVLDKGGPVPGKPVVRGDSPANDRVPALLSPGEIVVPRSAAVSPDRTMDFLNRLRKPRIQPHPEDVSTVLQALHHVRQGV